MMRSFSNFTSVFATLVLTCALLTCLECSAQRGRKVVVVGFDGLSSSRVGSMVREGSLPHFKQMMQEGISGGLVSTIPPLSPPAWTSVITGVNPGKHGIYSYTKGLTSTEEDYFVVDHYSGADRSATPLWKLLSDSGKRSIFINVPFTSPPDSTDGILVAGGPHPDSEDYAYPPELMTRFPSDYTLSRLPEEVKKESGLDYPEYLKSIFKDRKTAALELMDTESWDLFFIVFTVPERIQRYYSCYSDPNHPLYTEEGAAAYGHLLADTYKEMDIALGEFEERASASGANLLALSAFGHEPVSRLLSGEDFIRAHWPPEGRHIFVGSPDRYRGLFAISFEKPPEVNKENWEKYSNLAGEILEELKSLKDPESGETVIDTVYHRAQLYSGPFENRAPDIVAVEKSGYLFANWQRSSDGTIFTRPGEGSPSSMPGGDGILYAKGPDIATGKELSGAGVQDIVPTILYLEGASIPSYVDGKVLEQMIRQEFLDRYPVETMYQEAPLDSRKKVRTLSEEEEEALRSQLKVVGYAK